MSETHLSVSNNESPSVEDGNRQFEEVAKDLESQAKAISQSQRFQDIHTDPGDVDIELGERVRENEDDFKLRKYFENSMRTQLEIGGKPKKMGVSIKNLTVVGQGADHSIIADNFTPFKFLLSCLNPLNYFKKRELNTFNILNDINGYIEDGKMLLVLGRPGSGCSTLLRVVSNQIESYIDVTGEVKYGNIPSDEFGRYRGEAIYTPEEDIHYPTLTVFETLDFTLKLKTPHQRLPEETKANFRTKIFDLLVSMYGLVNQRNTIVGNEFVRGLSGGERKRMTITEAMVSGSSITCWDSSTRGLDAASALDYAKSLRIMSDTLHKTTIASFYQASDSIYGLFDKVLVLDKGRCIYFGPIHLAKKYFLDLGFDCEPRKSVADFLTGISNPQERLVRPGFEGRVPETSGDLESAWKRSALFREQMEAQQLYEATVEKEQPSVEFIEQIRNERSKTSSKRSPYTSSFITQSIALTKRQFQLSYGDKFTIVSLFSTVFIQSFILGGVYFQLDKTTNGLFTRGGAIFSSIIFMCILTSGNLHNTFNGRRILQKHKSYALYRPSAFLISQVLVDIPFAFAQSFLHAIIAYFMYGLDYNAGKFFIFAFTLVGVTLASGSLYRAFGNFTPTLFAGQNVMNFVFIFMVNYFGYTIPYDKMHPWFQWFFWVNPLGYAFKALMTNEFKDQSFSCAQSAIPYGDGYTDSLHRICPVVGSVEGEISVAGESYLKHTFSFKVSERAIDVIAIYLLWLFYIALNIFAIEFFDWTSGGYTHKVYKKGKAPKLNDVEEERNQNKIVEQATSNMKENLKIAGGIFTWENINYSVPVPGIGQKLLLDDVLGWIKPGQMTALMGSSGAGKTTLLDVLAKRKTIGIVQGESALNGKPLKIDFERITGYVEQMDVHNPGLTVREALRFSAKLRQEPEIPLAEKFEYVERVLEMMEMKHLGDALVGSLETGIGISVEERKRLTIGLELVAKPHILFLDEPTSGLDAQSSYNIVKFIRKLADAGMPLVCTIHQPSPVLFEHFDRLLLLAKGGKTVYFGDIGENSQTLINYFVRNGGRESDPSENPAEYILDVIGAGVHGKTDYDWSAIWKSSPEYSQIKAELALLKTDEELVKYINSSNVKNEVPREFATSFLTQFIEVYKRFNLMWWRDPQYTIGSFAQSIISGLIVGFTFFKLEDSSSDMNQRIFFLWEGMVLGVLLIYLVLPQFFIQKSFFKRDYASKYYSWHSFSLAIVAVEMPYVIISTTLFFFCTYWTAGLQFDAISGFYYWLIHAMFGLYIVSFSQALGAACFDIAISIASLPILLFYIFLFCGVQVPYALLPPFFRFMYYLNPAKYLLEGIVTTILKPVEVICKSDDLIRFTSPSGQTCEQYTERFTQNSPGYVVSLNANQTECGYCVYKNGEEYYQSLDWKYENRWRNFGILVAYWASSILFILGFVYLTKKARR
ncbi:ABC transporter G family protein [Heterostelium album PN500]|uniref:ABC transporter G family protein n=1 Tax=Heterostelium pallidum (strain ATCC 26659 / Pp 5 / PN500) TaxID=670386 RepID=D3B9U1_HETP5|nr:ABC transporter G family protein [Heterostelium album PN500]EFA82003.1 ABC transporter G family protein [Heterostelium album PN500]|eukprot:XP_020434120.1 ABC transporter G family protein [Heterostelium album PN500]